jgi:hypothetical protein
VATNYSDHKKEQIRIQDYWPEVFRSDINNSLTQQVLDRFLTADDTVNISGFIGTGNKSALINRQLPEEAPDTHAQAHRQAFQLAPTMYTKIGTVESALSFRNFLTQLELQGVDISRIPLWGNALEFNWVPPINIDMLVNYQDYFWSVDNIASNPQYFTIEDRCSKATDKLFAYSSSMLQRGMHFPIISVDFINNAFILQSDYTHIFTSNFAFDTIIANTINLNDKNWSVFASTYDSGTDQTSVVVNQPLANSGAGIPSSPPISGLVGEWYFDTTAQLLYEWDSAEWIISTSIIAAQVALSSIFPILDASFANNTISVIGKQDDIFIPSFVFFTKDTTQVNMNNKFWTVTTSTYDVNTYTTIITITEPLAIHSETPISATEIGQWYYKPSTDTLYQWDGALWNIVDQTIIANVSLSELVAVFNTELNCICSGGRGWDIGLWDDNSVGNVAWNTTLLNQISFATEAEWLVANTNPPNPLDLWYDTSLNELKQYGDLAHPLPSDPLFTPSWNVVVQNFSAILVLTTAQENWDQTVGCDPQVPNQWTLNNNWKHKTAIESFASVKRAQLPIFEYDSNLELNSWTQITRFWKYRQTANDAFGFVANSSDDTTFASPSRFELEPVKGYQTELVGGAWYIYLFDSSAAMNADINLTSIFTPGYRFRIVDDLGFSSVYTVASSEYRLASDTANPNLVGVYAYTAVQIAEPIFSAPSSGGLNNSRIIPILTSRGDLWQGYHVHWLLDIDNIQTAPTAPQPYNAYRSDITNTEPVVGNINYAGFTPQVGLITYGNNFQEITVDIPNIHTIDLITSLKYDSSLVHQYATPNSNELRVYINNVRQYGTYNEATSSATSVYTEVGSTLYSSQNIAFVSSITFNSSVILNIGDIIRIEVGPASLYDMGMYAVPVRTVESEQEFASQVIAGTQPTYKSLTTYELTEQNKNTINQYPLFDVYNLITGDVVAASPIVTFVEDQTAPVNSYVQRRLMVSTDGVMIEQHLLDHDDHLLFGYRDMSLTTLGVYWYSSLMNSVKKWSGSAWYNQIPMTTSTTEVIRTPVISGVDPIDLWNIDRALWLNTNTNKLYYRDTNTSSWVEITSLIVSDSDPSIRTIWRHGTNNEEYTPQYVDSNRVVVPTTNVNADWEVLHQWMYNPEHRNRSIVTLPQIVNHFRSIIQNQQPTPGLIGGGAYTKTQAEYNYGVGGTIKEFNGAFDTLISSVNITNTTPVGVLEFAATEYASNIRFLRDIFNQQIIDLCMNYQIDPTITFVDYIVDSLIANYENNDYAAQVYGDTSAYDAVTSNGVRNWIATTPMFGLSPLYKPHMIVDGEFVQIYNHDGHRTAVEYTTAEEDAISRKIVSKLDPRTNTPIGVIGASTPPASDTAFLTAFGGTTIRTGVFWYKTSAPRIFYRFEVYAVSNIEPSIYLNGVELPNGIYYYNTATNTTYIKTSGIGWEAIVPPGSHDISPMWREVNFQHLLGDLFLEVENRLYDVSVGNVSVFDYNSLTPTPSESLVYYTNYKKRFDEYVADFSISLPYANTQYSATDAFTWNYLTSTIIIPPHSGPAPTPTSCWQLVYTGWYNTPYPHLEPWKLQGYNDKPSWWDDEYLQTDGSRVWKFSYAPVGPVLGTGMWENIRIGSVPAGRTYPDGMVSTGNSTTDGQTLPTYNYFCVNISDAAVAGGYAPDQLLPPYYATVDGQLRSIYSVITQINAPFADYMFGDGSVIEWQWMVSAQYPYEKPIIAYLMQPIKFLRAAFGPNYMLVDNLEVDTTLNQVYSHVDALFHGDMYGINNIYESRGLNQWYVNYNRFTGFDTSGDFRHQWVNWTPLLTYQCNGIIDTNTLKLDHKLFDIIGPDYNVILANNGAINDMWVDAFNVSIISAPPSIIQYNNQSSWRLELNCLANTARTMQYYDVKAYPFLVETTTDLCHPYRYNISDMDGTNQRLYVQGNQTDVFVPNTSISITKSVDFGTFTVSSSVYESGANRTRLNIIEAIGALDLDGGAITLTSFVLPWSTGDMVILSTSKVLPAPLAPNTPYYVVTASNQHFQLAETFNDAISNITIDIISAGVGEHTVAEIKTSFQVMGGTGNSPELWYHYALDKGNIRTLSLPAQVQGLQSLINTIDGYAEYQQDIGVIQNNPDSQDFDFNTGRLINWGLEVERFIDWAYGLRKSKMSISDRYEYTVNVTNDTMTFVNMAPAWEEGTAIQLSTSGSLPAPIIPQTAYYVVTRDENGDPFSSGTIRLSASRDIRDSNYWIDFTTQGSGSEYASVKSNNITYPQFEINPTRNNIWINTPDGVMSNVLEGPYTDIRVRQAIFDQYGRALTADKLLVYRQDERNRIAILPEIPNDVDKFLTNDPYNYIHLGGSHVFIEGYEHFVLFNPYTLGGKLIYDSFLGLSVSKLEMDVYKKAEHTLRPTLGGYFLKDHKFIRNFEGSASDLNNLYDSYSGSDDPITNQQARALLGYNGTVDYLNTLDIPSKSQFLFYRGMLHAKGSVTGAMAYINSRKFVDASIDEFFAIKIAEFGDHSPRVYPEILLKDLDNIVDDVRFEFVGTDEDINRTDIQDAVNSKGFKLVTFADDTRWNNFPSQQAEIEQPLFLDAEVNFLSRVYVSTITPPHIENGIFDYWYNATTDELRVWDGFGWDTIVTDKLHKTSTHIYWKHNSPCDDVKVVRHAYSTRADTVSLLRSTSVDTILETPNAFVIYGDITNKASIDTGSIIVSGSSANNGTFDVQTMMYDPYQDVTYITINEALPVDGIGGTLTYQYPDFGTYATTVFTPASSGVNTYYKLNSEVVRMDVAGFNNIIHIYNVRPAYDSINPAKLVNRKTNAVVEQITLWHPAFGWNYYKAAHNIDLYNDQDPATYSNNIQQSFVGSHFWNFAEVGTSWLDTSNLSYIPYYDESIYPDINDRLGKWGELTPFASIKVYQWVRSTVPPSEWDALALRQRADITIAQNDKVSGNARSTVFNRTRSITTGTVRFGTNLVVSIPTNLVSDGEIVFVTSDSKLPSELEDNTKYLVDSASTTTPQTFKLKDIDTNEVVNISGYSSEAVVVNMGNSTSPINTLQSPTGIFSNGDVVTMITQQGGVLPKGSVSTYITSSNHQEVVFESPKTTTDQTGLATTIFATSGSQSVAFFTAKLATTTTGLANNGTAYSVNISINGVNHSVSVVGSACQTYASLVTEINNDLGSFGSITLNITGTALVVSSATVGSTSTVAVGSGTLFQSLTDFAVISSPIAGTNAVNTTYTANVVVNGVNKSLSISGGSAQTYETLLSLINTALGVSASAILVDGNIKITAVGTTPTISIRDINLFSSLTDFGYVNVISSELTEYTIANISEGETSDQQVFNLVSGQDITIRQGGSGKLTLTAVEKIVNVVPSFSDNAWVKQLFAKQRVFGAWIVNDTAAFEPIINWTIPSSSFVWYDNDAAEIYKNGEFVSNATVSVSSTLYSVVTTGTGLTVSPADYIDVVRPIHIVTEPEADFDPNVEDDGTVLVQWKTEYEYSQTTVAVSSSGVPTVNYYFWVEGSTIKSAGSSNMSMLEVHNALIDMPEPYLVVQKPLDIPAIIGRDTAPMMYREAILRNIAGYVNNNNQYMIQFTRDLTLRDHVRNSELDMLKNIHEEWIMIRQHQGEIFLGRCGIKQLNR